MELNWETNVKRDFLISIIKHFLAVFLGSGLLSACADDVRIKTYGGQKTTCSQEASNCPSITAISPIVAKPGAKVTVFGKNLQSKGTFFLEDKEISVTTVDDGTVFFLMPEGKPGLADLEVRSGKKSLQINSSSRKIFRRLEAAFPVMTADPSLVCSNIPFVDGTGELQTGTKDCSGNYIACQEEGQTGCVPATKFQAILANGLAPKIVRGQKVAGVVGVGDAYSPCNGPQQVGCVTSESYKSMDLSGASNLSTDLTSTGFNGALKSNASFEFWDSAGRRHQLTGHIELKPENILNGKTLLGVAGTALPAPPSCSSDGETGCVAQSPSYAAAVKAGAELKIIAGQTLAGVTGTVSLPAASKVLSGTSYGGGGTALSGTLSLPLASNVRTGSSAYGEPGALLTPSYSPDFPALANVRASDTVNGVAGSLGDCTAGNQSGCVSTAIYKSMDLSAAGTSTGLIAANFNASINSASTFEFWDASGTRHSQAGDVDLTAANIKDTIDIFGVTGTLLGAPANCSSDGQGNCLVDGGSYAAADLSGAASKILSGQTLAGVAGNITLPANAKVLSGTSFGVGGTGSSGSLTLPLASSVLLGSGAYGDSAAQLTPSYSPDYPTASNVLSSDTVNSVGGTLTLPAVGKVLLSTSYGVGGNGSTGTLTLPTASNVLTGSGAYGEPGSQLTPSYSPDFPALANVRSGDTVNGANGTLADCSSDGAIGCVVVGPTYAALLKTGAEDKIISGQTIGSVSGNVTLPAVGKVLLATSYGESGTSLTGTLTLPAAANVLTGSAAYGDPGAQLTPAYSPDYPTISNVLSSDTVNGAAGTLTLPLAAKVLTGTTYGVAGNDSTGTLTLPAASNVLTGSGTYGETGSLLTPSYSPDFPAVSNVLSTDTVDSVSGTLTLPLAAKVLTGTSYGTAGNGSTGTLTLPAASNVLTGSGTYGETGSLLTPSYSPDFPAVDNVLSSDTVNGAAGTLTLPLVSKVLTGTSYGASGNGSTGTLTLPAASNVLTGSGAYGEPGSQLTPSYSPDFPALANVRTIDTVNAAAGTLADCNAGNLADCVATSTYKTMDLSAMGTATGLTAANFETRIATAANSEFWDAAGARHSITGDADLSVDKVKAGVVIHGVTGQYPSASYPLASDTAATDLTNFTTQLTTDGSFEFFDSAGAKFTGSGDSELVNSNIKNAVAIESLSLTGNYVATLTCPTGWIKVPGDSAYGTGDFCVMKYEAKDVSTVATSQAASTPWVSITQTASITACRALGTGHDIISNAQWMTIGANVAGINGNWTGGTVGSGYLFAGHSDGSPNSACAASSNDTDFYVETNCTAVSSGDATEQRRTLTLSNSAVIWDLPGNVSEWVYYVNVGDKPGATYAWYEYTAVTGTTTTPLKDLVPTNAVKTFWINTWNSGNLIGQFYPGPNGTGGVLHRGSDWGGGSTAGVFSANMVEIPSFSNTNLGTRCSRTAWP